MAGGAVSSYYHGKPIESHGTRTRILSEGNINRLVEKLSRMRGAALKLGQFMSIQGVDLSLLWLKLGELRTQILIHSLLSLTKYFDAFKTVHTICLTGRWR
jgi:hypothetical protein